jgi:pyruvate/2-oxoglutarate dehydrogenase complex dihydrolipoamide dehydrogenase (E3) component
MPDFDVVVIGAGAAGLSTAAISAGLGLKVALIERGVMGGDCLNYGCVPSKALLAAAHAAHAARRAGRFGVRLPEPEIDWAGRPRPCPRRHRRHIAPTDSEARFRGMGVEVIRASGAFRGPRHGRGRRRPPDLPPLRHRRRQPAPSSPTFPGSARCPG